ncbi:MAG: hypothetical protein ACYC6R_07445 [Anaerolineales bacterium]
MRKIFIVLFVLIVLVLSACQPPAGPAESSITAKMSELQGTVLIKKSGSGDTQFAADPAMTMKIFKATQERGLRTRPLGNILAFSPPLSITEDEVDEIIKRLAAAMDGVA